MWSGQRRRWVIQYNPHAYQKFNTDFLLDQPSAALWLQPGLGKSVITLTAIDEKIYNLFELNKILITAPKRVSESVWQNEVSKWNHLKHLKVATIQGTPKQREKILETKADIYIISIDLIHWIVDFYGAKWPFDGVVIDESSTVKDHSSRRFKKIRQIRKYTRWFVELTGTPASNGYLNLWPQLFLLDQGERLGRTITAYRDAYFVPDQRSRTQVFSWKLRSGAKEQIDSRIADVCISMKAEDYLDLPELIEHDIPVKLDAPAAKIYKQVEKESFLALGDSVIDAGTAAVLTNKLLQAAGGRCYDEDKNVLNLHTCKIEAFMELIDSLQGEQALVFYNYQHERDAILSRLPKARVLSGDGDVKAWNEHKVQILLAHPASCAYGLNLQGGGARHAIWYGLNWSLELTQQANARLHRQGQKNTVVVHRLVVQDTVDEDVVSAIQSKDRVQDGLMEALKARREAIDAN